MKKKRRKPGFTLIELLIVMGILAILMSMVLIALNPAEQFNETADISNKTVTDDLIKANLIYYTSSKVMPWEANTTCATELATGGPLSVMPACVHELTQSGKLDSSELQSQELKDIYMSKCGSTAVLCYNPKSKTVNESAETRYNKFGVNQPGCPAANGTSTDCYWCRPVMNAPDCDMNATPTPTPPVSTSPSTIPTATPTPNQIATPTPTIAVPTPTPLYGIGNYKVDDTKMLRTYAVLAFDYPNFPPNYMTDISDRPDFGGTTTIGGFGWFVNGVPATTDADTIFSVTYAGDGNFCGSNCLIQLLLTSKHFTYLSLPYYWSKYVNGCGKRFYYRVVGWPGDQTGLIGPTYSAVIDCTTKVGVIDLSQMGTLPVSDFNGDGIFDETDYMIGALQTRFRAGGWQPPE